MEDAAWIALAGVAIGVVGKGLWDWLLAVGKVKADREARAEARRDKRAERRDDLQRETLLAAQETSADLVRHTANLLKHKLADPIGYSGTYVMPPELGEPYRATHARLRLLRSRIIDQEAQDALLAIQLACQDAANAETRFDADRMVDVVGEPFSVFQSRAGKLVREMDDPP